MNTEDWRLHNPILNSLENLMIKFNINNYFYILFYYYYIHYVKL